MLTTPSRREICDFNSGMQIGKPTPVPKLDFGIRYSNNLFTSAKKAGVRWQFLNANRVKVKRRKPPCQKKEQNRGE